MKRQLALIFGLMFMFGLSQEKRDFQWWNPAEQDIPVIEGQAWPKEVEQFYDRLPARARHSVSSDVWGLSKESAGLMIRFRSNSREIKVKYQLRNIQNYALNHMPATGVSGLDLYAITSDGEELWYAGQRRFGDSTVTYTFANVRPNDKYHKLGREYRLFLPLYNQVMDLEIGTKPDTYFEVLPVRKDKPIVVYGTSIAQGACASRPGMAWTALLGRKMDRPLVNLGFSGSGRLDTAVIDLLTEIDAKIYILDCMPNLTQNVWGSLGIEDDLAFKERILNAVGLLRAEKPDTPILLAEHAGFSDEDIHPDKQKMAQNVNAIQRQAYEQLKQEGIPNLHYLSKEDIGLTTNATVDGIHPTDLGMYQYADSYEKKVRSIVNEPIGAVSTTWPVTQAREPQNYNWEERHREILKMNQSEPPKMVVLANSIIHFWGGLPRSAMVREESSWKDLFTMEGVRNYAYGWDRIENVLWRVYHGELDGFEADKILVMIGTNNLHINTDHEILSGLRRLITAIKTRQPRSKIILAGLLPRRDKEKRIAKLNIAIQGLSRDLEVEFADFGDAFLTAGKTIDESLFSDGLHPNTKGYLVLREAVTPVLTKTP